MVLGFQYAVKPLKPKLMIVSQSAYFGDFLSTLTSLNDTSSSYPSAGKLSKMNGNLSSPLLSLTWSAFTKTSTVVIPGCMSKCICMSSITVNNCQSSLVPSVFEPPNLWLVFNCSDILGALNYSANWEASGLCYNFCGCPSCFDIS